MKFCIFSKLLSDQVGSISQLKKINSLISFEDKILFKKPTYFSKPIAKIKKGRVLLVQKCENKWCEVKTEEFSGWIEIRNIWGKGY